MESATTALGAAASPTRPPTTASPPATAPSAPAASASPPPPKPRRKETPAGAAGSKKSDRPRLRSVDYLTPEQLRRKREGNARAQRLLRAKSKLQIETLERKVREMQERNMLLESRLMSAELAAYGGVGPVLGQQMGQQMGQPMGQPGMQPGMPSNMPMQPVQMPLPSAPRCPDSQMAYGVDSKTMRGASVGPGPAPGTGGPAAAASPSAASQVSTAAPDQALPPQPPPAAQAPGPAIVPNPAPNVLLDSDMEMLCGGLWNNQIDMAQMFQPGMNLLNFNPWPASESPDALPTNPTDDAMSTSQFDAAGDSSSNNGSHSSTTATTATTARSASTTATTATTATTTSTNTTTAANTTAGGSPEWVDAFPPLPPELSSCCHHGMVPSPLPVVPFTTIATDRFWAILPKHSQPVCPLDAVILQLVHQRRQQDNALEFQKHAFPSVQSLLNPPCSARTGAAGDFGYLGGPDGAADEVDARRAPVSSTIVQHLRMILPRRARLPERVATLLNVSSLVRWLIAPTRANYDALPPYLHLTSTQLAVPHPPWVDVTPWPEVRDWFCHTATSEARYHTILSVSNETLSINWPYHDEDILLHGAGEEILVNPVFERHIRNLRNWTLGPRIVQEFPALKGKINIAPPQY